MSNITAITKSATGFTFTLGAVPTAGWDIWLNGIRLETEHSTTTYEYTTPSTIPPSIEVVNPYNDTDSHIAANSVRLQWQHSGATYYIIERSIDDVTYYRIGTLPGDGNIWHTFTYAAVDGDTYYKVYAADEDEFGYYPVSLELPVIVTQSTLPAAPLVSVAVDGGTLTVSKQTEIQYDEIPILPPTEEGGNLE